MSDETEIEVYYTSPGEVASEAIRIQYGSLVDHEYVDLDIREAVYLRYQLDGAISDYERAVGR